MKLIFQMELKRKLKLEIQIIIIRKNILEFAV